jgi:hypothetical protein
VSQHTYRAEWSPEDDEYVGLCAEFPSLSWLAPTASEAVAGIKRVVDDVVVDMAALTAKSCNAGPAEIFSPKNSAHESHEKSCAPT